MKTVEAPEAIEPWRIICAAQSEPDYSEERYMLIYAGDRSDDYYGKGYILLEAGTAPATTGPRLIGMPPITRKTSC
jgi:hypothetical protein